MSGDRIPPGRQNWIDIGSGSAMVIIDVEHFDALVLDMDGVITVTASVHARAWKQIFDEFLARRAAQTHTAAVPFDIEADYRRYVDGKPRVAGALSFLASRGINLPAGTPEEADKAGEGVVEREETALGLASRKDRYFTEILAREGVHAFPAAVALLHDAHRRGVRLAVATSSHHCADLLRASRLADLFEVHVDGFDIDRLHLKGKPSPDMFLEAARRLGVVPPRAAVFEDATSGVAAGHAGGFGLVVGVGSGAQASALLENGADQVVAGLGEISLRGSRASARQAARSRIS
jgi:alpha,alpha-trehalase